MNVYITFGGAAYDRTTKTVFEARISGVDDVRVYDDKWLMTQDFYRQNKWLWDHPHKRGFGWYAWKPYIIWHALESLGLDDGDVVLYVDADCVPIAPLGVLFDTCRNEGGIMLFASEGHRQIEWCKQDCYNVMGQGEDFNAPAGVARFMLFEKGPWRTTQFIMEWLTYCVNPYANTFDRSVDGERSDFIEHRAEQAIMTNLAHKYGIPLHREACGAGEGIDRDRHLYGQLFVQLNDDTEHVTSEPVGSAYFNVEERPLCTAR